MAHGMNKLVLASHNVKKAKELQTILEPLGIEILNLSDFPGAPEPAEDGETFAANAIIKAESAQFFTGLATIADDSGLVVDSLGGAPGVRSARYAGDKASGIENNLLLLKNMTGVPTERRQAKFVSVIALAIPGQEVKTYHGETHGMILRNGRGERGFGYDPLFLSDDLGITFAEASSKEKNRISHRARAIANMLRDIKLSH